jgi:DNA-directed RNA polymerase subunit L
MGHDISAYVKLKRDVAIDDEDVHGNDTEIAYVRIGAFNTTRQRIFYGMLPEKAMDCNAGVSGDGTTMEFSREEIANSRAGCSYYLQDPDMLESILTRVLDVERHQEDFKTVIEGIVKSKIELKDNTTREAVTEHLEDTMEFCDKILAEYDSMWTSGHQPPIIQIYFG